MCLVSCLKAKLPADAGLVLFLHGSKFALEESVDFSPIEQEAGINPINTTLPDYDTVPPHASPPCFLSPLLLLIAFAQCSYTCCGFLHFFVSLLSFLFIALCCVPFRINWILPFAFQLIS